MTSLTRPTAHSDNPDLYGIPKFFYEQLKEPDQKINDLYVEKKAEATQMDYTPVELQFISFAKEIFRSSLNENKLITFGSSEEKQIKFNQWMKNYPAGKSADLKLETIISSIWMKSRNNVLINLNDCGTTTLIDDEKKWLSKAAAQEEINHAQNKTERVFTYRQARSIFNQAKHSKL